jgi:hypothetical protein
MHECDRDKGMGALLHNLKRALLLEDSMNVKKIRRFEDFSPPLWRSYAATARPSGGKVGNGRCTESTVPTERQEGNSA